MNKKFLIILIAVFWIIVVIASPSYVDKAGKTVDPNFTSRQIVKQPINVTPRYVVVNYSDLLAEYNSYPQDYSNVSKPATNIIVLSYHGIYLNEKNDSSSMSYEKFKDQMFTLKSNGYETISLNDTYAFLRGEKQIPEKSFLLTFDDAIKESYYNADPILRMLNYKAVMFTIVHHSLETNVSYYLNTSELHQMQDSGRWDIESHSYDAHRNIMIDANGSQGQFMSSKEWITSENRSETDHEYVSRVQKDYQISKELLEREFNKTVIGFAFPFGEGEFNPNVASDPDRVVTDIGKNIYPMMFYQFRAATGINFRANYNDQKRDSYGIKRISANDIPAEDLLKQMDSSMSIGIPYIETFDNQNRWIPLWGHDNVIIGNNLVMSNYHDYVSGEMIYLDGSYLWLDYMYSVTIRDNSSDNVFLLARFQDSKNYVACRFDNKSASVVNVANEISTEVSTKHLGIDPLTNGTKLSVSVIGNNVGCYANDKMETEKYVNDIPPHGGIGIKVESIPTNRSVIFGSVAVEYPFYRS
jgi:peptidoglycan/xylan/chitin deacetylase (PgdA/CDA1 family)